MTTPSKAIDPGRVGLSKSLMTSWCERQGFYQETVRTPEGYRIYGPKSEPMLFGTAVDEAHLSIVSADMYGADVSIGSEAFDIAVEAGWNRVKDDLLTIPDPEPIVFQNELRRAMELFVTQPYGLDAMRPHYSTLRAQGDNGQTLRLDDVIGTPDYICEGVIDVKTSKRGYYPSKFTESAEMPVYAYLYTGWAGGELPKFLAYQVYVRVKSPYWQWLEVPATEWHVRLGQHRAQRWRKGIAAGDPDLFSFTPAKCHECPFAKPMPELGFEGCPIGLDAPLDDVEGDAA